MASPMTPTAGRALSLTPGARVLQSPLSDETIWKRLKDAGFDEESIKRRDKAALIGYIAKLEAEIFDVQHHMGLLLLERKELASKYEQMKASAERAELMHKCDQAAHASALAEAKKREESLKKALGVEKECIASMEKALHEMRTESAETKVTAECQLAEARKMMEEAQKKFLDAEEKLRGDEALHAEATRYRRAAERMLQEVEAREDDLSRRISAFKADCDSKEKELTLERQSLSERRKTLQQEHERLLDGQALLNQREDYIASKSVQIDKVEKLLEASKEEIKKERRALNDEKSNMELRATSLSQREEALIKREAMLDKKEQELLVLQEKIASKESAEIQKVIANHESVLRTRNSEFEAQLEMKRKLVEDEIEAKRRAWELREVDLNQREDLLLEKEHDLDVQSRTLLEKEKDAAEKMNLLDDKESRLNAAEKDVELRISVILKEREEINKMKSEVQKSWESLEDKKKQVDCAKEKLETMKSETNELSVLELKLTEEVDIVRSQNLELVAEEDRLKVEKEKFEAEWELIEEKREELRREAQRVAQERTNILMLLKEERNSLKLEKEAVRDQHKRNAESFNQEREEFMTKMEQERSEWFNKIQQEHADFLLGIEMQKRELESSIEKRREEVESYLRDKENAFEFEKMNTLQFISSLKEKAKKELEQISLEMKKLDDERVALNSDRERRDNEWTVINTSIEELKGQTQKLEKQRELLHAEKEEVCAQIEELKKLEDLKLVLDNMEVADMQKSIMESSRRKMPAVLHYVETHEKADATNNINVLDSPTQESDIVSPNSDRFSWLKRCTELIFKNSPQKLQTQSDENSFISYHEAAGLKLSGNLGSNNRHQDATFKSMEILRRKQPTRHASDEPKVIFEVSHGREIIQGTRGLGSETNEVPNERITHSGRKRQVENSLLDDPIGMPEQSQNKKVRHQEVAVVSASTDVVNDCVISTQSSVPEDQHATEAVVEDTNVLIIDQVVKISEVTCEVVDTGFTNQEKHPCQQNSEASLSIIVQEGETNSHPITKGVESHIELGTEQLLSQDQEDLSEETDMRLQNPIESNNNEMVTENVRRRTRSKKAL